MPDKVRHRTREMQLYRNYLDSKNYQEQRRVLYRIKSLGLTLEECRESYQIKQKRLHEALKGG